MQFQGQGILLDIEGTTSSVSFVYDVMFPMVRRELSSFLKQGWDDVDVQLACDQIAHDAGQRSLQTWAGDDANQQRGRVETEVLRLMDDDVKATGLKQLQGLIWRRGFESGELEAHVYPEVADCLQGWRELGIDLRIYSSGSVQAQHLFFGHTQTGNLLPLFSGHYDTNLGPKKEAGSYAKIAVHFQLPPDRLLFLSDIVAELDAAREAGFQTCLCVRPGNAPVDPGHGHPRVENFNELKVTLSAAP